MTNTIPGRIYLLRQICFNYVSNQNWRKGAMQEFAEIVGHRGFPCLFGQKARRIETIQYLFCEKREFNQHADFFSGLMEYTKLVKETMLKERIFCPLVVFFSEDFYVEGQQHRAGWEAINWIYQSDPEVWPSNVSRDTENPSWSFCFNGVQLFINISSGDHKILRSRNLGKHLVLVINPRQNFDLVANAGTKSGRLIREKIRLRVAKFNNDVVPKELGFYGEEGKLEWEQYQLSEPGLHKPDSCPIETSAKPILQNDKTKFGEFAKESATPYKLM